MNDPKLYEIDARRGDHLYFGFGANMNPTVMAKHCPAARAMGPAELSGFRLCERLHADIEPGERDDVVHGVIWQIGTSCVEALDAWEDVPGYYLRIRVAPRLIATGEEVAAFAYAMNLEAARGNEGMPYSRDYAERCAAGARAFLLPVHELYAAHL